MGLLFSPSHLNGENISPQSAFYTDRFKYWSYLLASISNTSTQASLGDHLFFQLKFLVSPSEKNLEGRAHDFILCVISENRWLFSGTNVI